MSSHTSEILNNFLLFFFFLGDYTLKIDLADFEKNSRYAQYKLFKVGDEKVLKFSNK